jgi:hypothetical protein
MTEPNSPPPSVDYSLKRKQHDGDEPQLHRYGALAEKAKIRNPLWREALTAPRGQSAASRRPFISYRTVLDALDEAKAFRRARLQTAQGHFARCFREPHRNFGP